MLHNYTLRKVFDNAENADADASPAEAPESAQKTTNDAQKNKLQKWQGAGPGRPKGVPNRITRQLREFINSVLTDPEYQADIRRRARSGTLNPSLEVYMWQMQLGKPAEHLRLETALQDQTAAYYSSLSSEELAERLRELMEQVQQVPAITLDAVTVEEVDAEADRPITKT